MKKFWIGPLALVALLASGCDYQYGNYGKKDANKESAEPEKNSSLGSTHDSGASLASSAGSNVESAMGERTVTEGDEIQINFTGRFEDQTIFTHSDSEHPMKIIAGAPEVKSFINEAVMGMRVGEKKAFDISGEEVFGMYNQNAVVRIPADKIPKGTSVGGIISNKQGSWVVKEIKDGEAVLDGNHPLKRKTLSYEIELVSIT